MNEDELEDGLDNLDRIQIINISSSNGDDFSSDSLNGDDI